MQYYMAAARPALASFRNPSHVNNPLFEQFYRHTHIAYFRHSGITYRAYILQYQNATFFYIKCRIIYTSLVFLDIFKHNRFACVLHQRLAGGAGFDNGSVLTKVDRKSTRMKSSN